MGHGVYHDQVKAKHQLERLEIEQREATRKRW
jgi:hypothetical protein